VRAYVDGPLRARGWIDVSSLEAVVRERGRIAGTPIYLVPGDRVRLRRAEGALAEVEASALLGHPDLARSPSFHGAFPLARLGAALSGSGAGPTPGRRVLLRRAAPLRPSLEADVALTIPALDPPLPAIVLREDGDQLGVRVGNGPYLVGYVPRSALEPGPASQKGGSRHGEVLDPWANERDEPLGVQPGVQDPWADEPEASHEASPQTTEEQAPPDDARGALTPMLERASMPPVWRVRAGARVVVDGATMAVFEQRGMAVELARSGDRVSVLAAVDETVTVRGTVAARDLMPP
jgi:hypothetical protein